MTVRFYQSSDQGAPVLRGATPGDLINLLDKCLVTGYGSKPAAGWSKPFQGANIAVFKQGAGSNGMHLRVDDTSALNGNRAARVVGYETMSDVDTGAPSPFPNAQQQPGGAYWYTHYTGNIANARTWRIIADEMFFYFFLTTYPENNDVNDYYQESYAFGDIVPYKPGDTTHTVLLGYQRNSSNSSEPYPFEGQSLSGAMTTTILCVARSYTNLGGPIRCGWHTDHVKGSSSFGQGNLSYPHGPDGGLYLAPVWMHEPQASPYSVRGVMPGMWVPCHFNGILGAWQTVIGQGQMAGKTFLVRKMASASALFEISDTWER
ncbi:hypothetical protein XccvBFoX4_gp36 [Xanthomonas phage FoX4]|uniref:Tail assembly protein n=1 Tax=Xanthomonas phage FoX4 TaxID=2723900 RepID=A0A858WJV7_9CAUD|nr:tail assembly protein [Xanthomonas phage FoX4]QJI52990.1 hypothetical protein XccvBFoX4_gp36 [Xanthomonas phage FoX4]